MRVADPGFEVRQRFNAPPSAVQAVQQRPPGGRGGRPGPMEQADQRGKRHIGIYSVSAAAAQPERRGGQLAVECDRPVDDHRWCGVERLVYAPQRR